ncbi:MAG TPA: hypothetical protein VEU62_10025, partial [Bryobacterales bacterium]|nr:hypothetical protein [Bryobacterales bacterium]
YTIRNPDLKPPRYQNWSLGLEQRLPHGLFLRGNFLRKRGHDGFTYVNTLTANNPPPPDLVALYHTTSFDGIFNLVNLRRDVYDSGEITVHQSLGEQYEWMASYTRSRALSNAVVTFSIDQPLSVVNNVGPMPWDAPNRLVSWGYLPTPRKNWALAYLLDARTGFPYSVQNEDGGIVGAVNAHRYPNYFSLNLHLERRFRLRGYRLALRGGFNNITNHQNPTVVNNTIGSPIFLHYFGSEGRHFVFRIRWLGKEETGQSK